VRWDPVTTLRRALWIGGGQWAGKSTVAGILAGRHGLTHYHYDYHDARAHQDRRLAAMLRRGETPATSPRPILAEGWGLRPELVVLIAADAVEHAREQGVRVLEVDGSGEAEEVADLVADHFAPFLR